MPLNFFFLDLKFLLQRDLMYIKIFTLLLVIFFAIPSVEAIQAGGHGAHGTFGATTHIPNEDSPWLTGPLLTPSSHSIPQGSINIEPYLFVFGDNGTYDKEWKVHSTDTFYTVNLQLPIQVGLSKRVDFQIVPQVLYQRFKGQSATRFGDFSAGFDFQVLHETQNPWQVAIKFGLYESFPTGKFQKLNPKKLQTDDVGSGSFATSFGLVFGRRFHLATHKYLATRLAVIDTVFAPVHVKGFNSYGGGFRTNGTVYPGNAFNILLGLELALTRHWVLALDVESAYANKTRFSGKHGFTKTGARASVGGPSSNLFSLAPAIEYNFSESLGLIAGSWFTVAGRNSDRFWSGAIALNYYGTFKKSCLE